MKPHLIVVGAQKSGTTWLQHVMDSNKQFFCPAVRQEISFFSNYWEKGFDYYSNLYKNVASDIVTVDVSPRYQEVSTTPARIKEYQAVCDRPIKLILICREPVARLESAYKMYIKQGHEYKNLEEAIVKSPDLIEKGKYAKALKEYYEVLDKKDILVLFFEDLQSDSKALLKQVQDFLEIDTPIINTYDKVRINNGGKRKSNLLSTMIRYSGRSMRYLGLTDAIHKIKRTKVLRKVRDFNEIPFDLSQEDKDFVKTLSPRFESDTLELQELLKGRKIPNAWKSSILKTT